MSDAQILCIPKDKMNDRVRNGITGGLEMHRGVEVMSAFPRNVVLSITDACNQRCRFCFGLHKPPTEAVYANPHVFRRMTWMRHCGEIQVIGTGEALCHPCYSAIIRDIRRVAPYADLRLYTNGLGLRGKRLDATLEACSSVNISVNALSRDVYESLIPGGNHAALMANLDQLAARKPKEMDVVLSLVVLRQTVHEVEKFVDYAAERGFAKIIALYGVQSPIVIERGGLSPDSFDICYADHVDVDSLKARAAARGVELVMDQRNAAQPEDLRCADPWIELRLLTAQQKGPRLGRLQLSAGWRVQVCCGGVTQLFAFDNAVADLEQLWNCDRIRLIRRTVNSENLLANKMCAFCRLSRDVDSGDFTRLAAIRRALRANNGFFHEEWIGSPTDPA